MLNFILTSHAVGEMPAEGSGLPQAFWIIGNLPVSHLPAGRQPVTSWESRTLGTPGGQQRDRTAQETLTLSSSVHRLSGVMELAARRHGRVGQTRKLCLGRLDCPSPDHRARTLLPGWRRGDSGSPGSHAGLGLGTTYSFGLAFPGTSQSTRP